MAKSKSFSLARVLYSAMFLALAVLMPIVEGHIGIYLAFMELFVLLCGFICGSTAGIIVGILAPVLYAIMFGGDIFTAGNIITAASLAAGAFVGGLLYKKLDKSFLFYFVEILAAIICSGLVCGAAEIIFIFLGMYGDSSQIGFDLFWNAIVSNGYVRLIQIICVPLVVNAFRKNRLVLN